jgi:hypothetical protein
LAKDGKEASPADIEWLRLRRERPATLRKSLVALAEERAQREHSSYRQSYTVHRSEIVTSLSLDRLLVSTANGGMHADLPQTVNPEI